MKYVLVVDESGAPLYYDHPDGQMLCPILVTTKVHMKTNFDEFCRVVTCGSTKLVQQQYDTLIFLLVSDEGEPESVLRSQLHLIYQLFLLLFGPGNMHIRKRSLDKFKKTIQRVVDTSFHLLKTSQSILVQSIELLEVNKDILNKCTNALKSVVANAPGSTHALLFVGTKLLAWYFRPKSFQLSSMDMFLLILFFRGAFHPTVREIAFTQLQVADYTDHEEVIRAESARSGGTTTSSSGYRTAGDEKGGESEAESEVNPIDGSSNIGVGHDSAEEDGGSVDDGFDTATEGELDDSFINEPITIDVTNPIILFQSGWLDELFDANAQPNDVSSGSDSVPINITQGLRMEAAQSLLETLRAGLKEGQANDAVVVLQYALHMLNILPEQTADQGSFGTATKQAVIAFQQTANVEPTGEANVPTLRSLFKRARSLMSSSVDSALSDKSDKSDRSDKSDKSDTNPRHRPSELRIPLSRRGTGSPEKGAPASSVPSTPRRHMTLEGTQAPRRSLTMDDLAINMHRALDEPSTARGALPLHASLPSIPPPPLAASLPSISSPPLASSASPPAVPKNNANNNNNHETSFEQLYLRSPTHNPMWVYCSEVQESTTLVVINKGLAGKQDEKDRLDKLRLQLRDWLRKNYAGYLITKERTHLPILTWVHALPGLVHYIFVDRTTNRVRAPTITPLHGQLHRDAQTAERMVATLKKHVWRLVHTAHEHLSMGHTAMLVRRSDFLYSYRLWVEDDEGVEQVLEQSIPANPNLHNTPIGHRFYKELLRWLFPSQSQQMKCYELYTLYLGILPAALVSKNDRALIALLLERDVD